MDLRTREAIRYLGYGKNKVDEKTFDLIKESFQELERIADKRGVYHIFELLIRDEKKFQIGPLKIESKSLYNNLKGCSKVAVVGATLGTEVDRKIRQYEVVDLPRAVVLGACAAAYLEDYCDEMVRAIQEDVGKEYMLRPRFSPGYGDFTIDCQDDILRIIDAQKKIGLSLTKAKMMTPSKSVTAVIGICDYKENKYVAR